MVSQPIPDAAVPHPSAVLTAQLKSLGLNIEVGEIARQLSVARTTYSRFLHQHIGMSPEMACKVVAWVGHMTGDTVSDWLQRQADYDAYVVSKDYQRITAEVRRIEVPTPTPRQGALFRQRVAA